MTVTEERRTRVRMPPGASGRFLPAVVPAVAVFVLAAALRLLGIGRSADLFVDELIYRRLGASVTDGGFPRTEEGLFFLHPPGYFYVQAGWGRLIGISGDLVTSIYQARALSALLGAATAVLVLLVVTRASGSRTAGVVAAVLFALDPYVIRQNDRAMLDTLTMLWVVAGYLALLSLCRTSPEPAPRHRRDAGRARPSPAQRRALLTGLLFGLALLTKDHSALITLVPLLLALALGWGPPRRLLALVGATALVPYAIYITVVFANGHLGGLWWAKRSGIERLIGVVQQTGFNSPGTPSLTSRLIAELATFASTYGLLALGLPALVILLRRRDPGVRMLALLELCAGFTLLFALTQGALEEQALYLLVVPNLIALGVAAALISRPAPASGDGARAGGVPRRRRGLLIAETVVLVAAVAFSGFSYAQSRTQRDDGYARLRTYMAEHVPKGAAVTAADGATSGGISHWALEDRYRMGDWLSAPDRARAHVHYMVVPWKLIDEGYGRLDNRDVRRLAREGRLVFSVHERSYGTLALYELSPPGNSGPGGAP